jgi:hypothetical protein
VRHLHIALAVAVLAGGFSILGLAAPDCAYACSCIQPRPIAEYANEPDTVILSGTVTAVGNDLGGTFRVERWFKGSSDVVEIAIQGGNGADCGLGLSVGQQLVMVAYVSEGVLQPSICSPAGDLSTPEGVQLQAETVAAFGEGTAPGGADAPGGGTSGGGGIPGIVVLGGAVVVGLLAIVAGASFVSGRRET